MKTKKNRVTRLSLFQHSKFQIFEISAILYLVVPNFDPHSYFQKGKNAAQAHRKLCGVYGDECLSERQCQNLFARFRSGNFDVQNVPRPGRPIIERVDEIL